MNADSAPTPIIPPAPPALSAPPAQDPPPPANPPMRRLRRMAGLVAAYPGRLAAFVLVGIGLGAAGAAPIGMVKLLLDLLENPVSGGARAGSVFHPEFADRFAVIAPLRRLVALFADKFKEFAEGNMRHAFFFLLGAGVVIFLFKCFFEYLNRYLAGWLRQRVVRDTQIRLARHLMSLDFAYFQTRKQGDLVSRLTHDLAHLGTSAGLLCGLVTLPIEALFYVGAIIALDWRLAIVGLGLTPMGAVLIAGLSRAIRRASAKTQERTSDLTQAMVQFLAGMRVIKAFAREDYEAGRFELTNDHLFGAAMRNTRARARERVVSEFVTALAGLAVLALGGLWVLNEEFSAGTLMAFFLALGRLYPPVKELSRLNADFQEASAGADRVFSIFDTRCAQREGSVTEWPADHTLRFEGVFFHYAEDAPVLRGLDLELAAGKTTALVGKTGGGKSTVADLLLRLRDPVAGRVTIGGIPVEDFTLAALRGGIALVNQDAFLFNGTLRENIAYGAEPDPERVEAAARAAQIHDEIMAMPAGYDTEAGDRGANLSGGQRQRVTIARALYKNAPVLVLDEATSSLDAASEAKVREALAALTAGRTCLIIAHRLSTIRRADAIAVLDGGRIASVGTHEELLVKSPAYARLVMLQG